MVSTNNLSSHVYAGEFRHSLDGKKRVTIPSTWRRGDTDDFFLLPSTAQPCLLAMPPEVYKQIGEEAKATARSPADYRNFVTFFYSKAQFVSTDKAGRLLLPEEFCTKLGLVGDTVLTGGMDRIQIWSPANWTKFQDSCIGVYEEVARSVGL